MRTLIAIAVLLLVSFTAQASNFYVLGGIGVANTPAIQGTTAGEHPGSTYAITAGWKTSSAAAIELEYQHLWAVQYKTPVLNPSTGFYTNKTFNRSGNLLGLSLAGTHPLDKDGLSIVGKIGVSRADFSFSNPESLSIVPSNYSRTSLSAGAGIQYQGKDGTIVRFMVDRKSGPTTSVILGFGTTF